MANERQDTIVPTMNQVESACMTFRHDFGLLSQEEKECLRIDAQHWLQCWLKELNTIAPLSSKDNRCKCDLRTSLVGDGCRYCNPQYYIDMLEEQVREQDSFHGPSFEELSLHCPSPREYAKALWKAWEEIAGWLREAADCFEMIGDEFLGERTLKEYSRKLLDRAAQVESMRCETCSKNRVTNWPTLTACPWRGCGGCFHHETMEATCQVEKK